MFSHSSFGRWCGCLVAMVFLLCGLTHAQAPAIVSAPPATVVFTSDPVPVTVARRPVIVHYASPAVVSTLPSRVVARPTTVMYAPVTHQAPTVVYSPAAVPATTPVVTYRPIITSYAPTPVVTAGRPIVARTKYYIPGQPVRNLLRAITP